MDGRFILLTATLCLSLWDQEKFTRIQDIHNNGNKVDEVYYESINDTNLVLWHITSFVFRGLQSVLVKSKICSSLSYVCFSYVLCENTKKFRK